MKIDQELRRLTIEGIRSIVNEKEKIMQCNCDLDNWQPETITGHSWVCRIHKAAIAEWKHPVK